MSRASSSMLLLVVFLAIRQLVAQPEEPPPRPFNLRFVQFNKERTFIYWQYPEEQDVEFEYLTHMDGNWKVLEDVKSKGHVRYAAMNAQTKGGSLKACRASAISEEICSGLGAFDGPPIQLKDAPHGSDNGISELYASTTLQVFAGYPANLLLFTYGGKTWISWVYPEALRKPGLFFEKKTHRGKKIPLKWEDIQTTGDVLCAKVDSRFTIIGLKACYKNDDCSYPIAAEGPIKIDKNTSPGSVQCVEEGVKAAAPQGLTKEEVVAYVQEKPHVLTKVIEELPLEVLEELIKAMKGNGWPPKPSNVRFVTLKHTNQRRGLIYFQYPRDLLLSGVKIKYKKIKNDWTDLSITGTTDLQYASVYASTKVGLLKACGIIICSGLGAFDGPAEVIDFVPHEDPNGISKLYASTDSQEFPDNLQLFIYEKSKWISWVYPQAPRTPGLTFQYKKLLGDYTLLDWEKIQTKADVQCAKVDTNIRLIILRAWYVDRRWSYPIAAEESPLEIVRKRSPGSVQCVEEGVKAAAPQGAGRKRKPGDAPIDEGERSTKRRKKGPSGQGGSGGPVAGPSGRPQS